MDEVTAPDVITLDRIRLRRPSPPDAETLFECGNDLDVARYMDWAIGTSMSQVIERMERRATAWQSGEEFYWIIALRDQDRAIGAISCRVDRPSAHLGFFLSRRHWRHGYATEAARAIVGWAMSDPAIWRVWATCDVDNTASARVLEKAGLSLEDTLPRAIVRPNLSAAPRDAYLYSRVRHARPDSRA